MKKLISFICTLALLLTVFAPLTMTRVEASTVPFSRWKLTGEARVVDGVLYMTNNTTGSNSQAILETSVAGFSTLPDKYTIYFSMKATGFSGNMGLQGGTGVNRAGFYLHKNQFSSMDTGQRTMTTDMENWHDYALEVDHLEAKQRYYVDDEFIGEQNIAGSSVRNQFYFWCSNTGGDFMISDFSIVVGDDASAGLLSLTQEYTEAFRQDWDSIDGWMVEPEQFVTHYPEEGLIRLHVSGENLSYRSIERPLRAPANYDMEWRIKVNELSKEERQGAWKLELSTDSRHTWIDIGHGRISYYNYDDSKLYDGPKKAIPFKMDYEWHNWKAEVRGGEITWFLDGKEIISYPMLKSGTNRWHVSTFMQNETNESADLTIDWIEYTPYFEENLEILYPQSGSEFYEGKSVAFAARPKEDVEAVDYYLNSVYVGSGSKENNYMYVLENAKVGKYNVCAKVGETVTVENEFSVVPDTASKISLSRSSILSGESVKVFVEEGDAETKIQKVEFFVNGQSVFVDEAAPFETELSDIPVGTASVFAKVFSMEGSHVVTEAVYVDVEYDFQKPLSIGREYMADYTFEGGNGEFFLNDGYFVLDMKNQDNNLTVKTKDGEEIFDGIGKGDFRAVVASGHAELYWKGQFLASVLLPYAPGNQEVRSSGIKNASISGCGVKTTILGKTWKNDTEVTLESLVEETHYALEFDKTDSSPEVISYADGLYENEIHFREDGIYAKRQLHQAAEVTELKLSDKVEPGYYRLVVGMGLANLSHNNRVLGDYRCNLAAVKPGLTRAMTNPAASTFVAVKTTEDIYYHRDAFENDTELHSDDYWDVHPETYQNQNSDMLEVKNIAEENGNHYINISGKGTYLLNGIANYPSIKWRGMTESKKGRIYLVFRSSFNDRKSRIGYDFDKQRWFCEIFDGGTVFSHQDSLYAPNAFEMGKWYDFELVAKDYNVKLLRDGVEVFSSDLPFNLLTIYYGRCGVGATNSEWSIDDFEYTGQNRVTPGSRFTNAGSYSMVGNSPGMFYKATDGNIYGTAESSAVKTTDKGHTWGGTLNSVQAPAAGVALSSSMATMPDGTMVYVYGGNDGGTMYSYVSKDGGETWSTGYEVQTGHGNLGTVGLLTCTKNGRLFITATNGSHKFGWTSIFYSDDGMNWTKSETELTTHNTDTFINEASVIDTPRENEVWLYGRTQTGFVCYWVSKDNGKTFDATPHHSRIIQAATSHHIRRDWNEEQTYYSTMMYDAQTYNLQSAEYPRSRLALLVSYDGMESWEYITDLMENNAYAIGAGSDTNLNLIDDQLYWRTAGGGGGFLFGVQDIDKIKTLKRYPSLHKRDYYGIYPLKHIADDHCVVPKTDGSAWIFGSIYDVKVTDGRLDVDSAELAFSVDAVKQSNNVIFVRGDGKVTFTEGQTTVDVNGKTITAERAVLVNGYLDIKTLCEVYGKVYRETENSFGIIDRAEAIDYYQTMFDSLA